MQPHSPCASPQASHLPPEELGRTRSGVKRCRNCCSAGAKCGGRIWQNSLGPQGPALLGKGRLPSSRDQSSKWGTAASPTCHDLREMLGSIGVSVRGQAGFSPPAHACTHMHTHVLMPLHTPQPRAFDSPYLLHRCEAASPAAFAPCLRADLRPQVPLFPTSGMPLIPPQPSPDKPRAAR